MVKRNGFPHCEGKVSRQAHADFPKEAIYEREAGREGFFGPASHFHHRHPPTGWSHWEGPLRPRAFDLNRLPPGSQPNPWSAHVLLYNESCRYRLWHLAEDMTQLARNADGDDLIFVHKGQGDLFCDYGHIAINSGDYLVLPRSTNWRIQVTSALTLLLIEATGSSYQLPDKGLLGAHAFFDPAKLDIPEIDQDFLEQQDEKPWQVLVKHRNRQSTVTYPFNPLDAIGWHGDLAPVKINWRDFRPLMSHRYHLPPSAHTTFVTERFVVCTFVPRPIETDPGALKLPFYHNNNDYDEVLFYHHGQFASRDNIEPGMMTFHPAGFTHGPHPKAFKQALNRQGGMLDEVAVMVDARDPLDVGESAEAVEWHEYVKSWR